MTPASKQILLAVTKNPHTSSAVLEIVAGNSTTKEEILIQKSLASNPNILGKVAETLANSEDGNILWDLYHNPNPNVLSPEQKRSLGERLEPDIRTS